MRSAHPDWSISTWPTLRLAYLGDDSGHPRPASRQPEQRRVTSDLRILAAMSSVGALRTRSNGRSAEVLIRRGSPSLVVERWGGWLKPTRAGYRVRSISDIGSPGLGFALGREERMGEGPGRAAEDVEYLFGDSSTACHRLRLLAEIFAGSSRSFLSQAPSGPGLAVDIGCGPGYTTRLVSSTMNPRQTVGMDISKALVAEAKRLEEGDETYLVHDANVVPFPIGPADVLYARFLATHLADPAAVIRSWASQLVSGGLLLLDEVDSIVTTNDVLSRYLEVVNSLLIHEGRNLYIGPRLAALRLPGLLDEKASDVRPLAVQDRQAARTFRLNLEAWRHRRFVVDTYGGDAIRRLADELEVVAHGSGTTSSIEWRMRQIVFERV